MRKIWLLIPALIVFVACKSGQSNLAETYDGQGSHTVTNSGQNNLVGAYGKVDKVTQEDIAVFNKAMKGTTDFTPIGVSQQVVAGTNYVFICKDSEGKEHTVAIFQPLPGQGEPRVTSIDGRRVGKRIAPLPSGIDINNLQDCTIPAAFSANDFHWMGGNLSLSVYSEVRYDAVEIALMQPGDTLVYESKPLIVKEKQYAGNCVVINGDVENGGCRLMADDGGTYSAKLMDDHSVYTLLGKKEIPLSENLNIIDCGENLTDPVSNITTNQKLYIENLPEYKQDFLPTNTTVAIERGVITTITRRWIP